MYKITATIEKEGNTPISWTRYSDRKMTRQECIAMMTVKKEVGKSKGATVKITNFSCNRCEREGVI